MSLAIPAAWIRVALLMFAVGWGANQFSPMLIVYRHELGLGPGEIAGLFAIYAATLIPGLLLGGALSDRVGRRACVLPFAALSPLATLLLILGPHDLALIAAGRALAGLCSGMVFGPATAWVLDLSAGDAVSARRAALALSAGFGLGPVVAALLAQWAGDPLVVPYLPHLALGAAALAVGLTAPASPRPARAQPVISSRAASDAAPSGADLAGGQARTDPADGAGQSAGRPAAPPAPLRTRAFWLGVAPAAPFVFGTASLAIVVLPEEVTSAQSLSAGYAGLMTALAFGAGVGIQPFARRLAGRSPHGGIIAGLGCAAAGAAVSIAAVAQVSRPLAGVAAVLLGLGYGLSLVSGLHQAERLAGPRDRGAVVACYYVLAYLGFAMPYVADVLNAPLGKPGTFALLAAAAVILAGLSWLRGSRIARAGQAAVKADRTTWAAAARRGGRPEVRTAARPRSGA
ncbi:MFS transporter [Trebonia kvetii]|uniref:MFS transporter n=1 Tax=Trebonia kvetii TaxID=2480626 RepID=A0A6P2BWK9_9ACTN|nr:MFS transporter [Trebonia kvetii]TVZ03444.1 MFS transporter [Trebonia kvetii]